MTSYLGSKAASGAYQAIIAAFPPHDTYIEPFLGTGAVLRRKPPAEYSIALELDQELCDRARAEFAMPPGAHLEIRCADAFDYLSSFDYAGLGRVLIYCDPPYLAATKRSSRYRHELRDTDHRRLCQLLVGIAPQASIAISGYPSSRYDEWLPGWRSIEFQVMSHVGPRTEKLWMSYPAGAAHWIDYAGRNFTDRQRIKRKADRWGKNYAAMPPAERLAVLARILQTDASMPGATSMPPVAEPETSMRSSSIGAGGPGGRPLSDSASGS